MRFSFDPNAVTTSAEILDKDNYEFSIGSPKSYYYEGQNGNADRYGVAYPLTVTEGIKKGKTVFFNADLSTEIGNQVAKRFLIAGYGFESNKEGEEAYNVAMAGKDFGVDTDSNTIGEAWTGVSGKRVKADVDINISKKGDGARYQKWVKFTKF